MVECAITRDIDRDCKDGLGGISKIYLFEYEKYSRSQITFDGQEIDTFPEIETFEVYSSNASYTESTEVDGGAVSWKQSFTIDIQKNTPESEVYKLVKKDYRAIFVDRLGNCRILGLYNGLKASITSETGSDKGSFNGYRVSFEGQEDRQAQYFSAFLLAYLFEDGNNFIFQDDNNYIFNS